MPAHILLMKALHHHYQRRAFWVIQARGGEFFPPCQSSLPVGVAFRFFSIVRIVHDQNVPPDPKQRAADRRRKPRAASTRVELRLGVLFFTELETMPPQRLIPRSQTEPPRHVAVINRQ